MFQNIFYKIRQMQTHYRGTGKYILDYENKGLICCIRHLDSDEILLERRLEGSSGTQRLLTPLKEFRLFSSEEIFELFSGFQELESAPASGVPGRGRIYDKMRLVLLGSFPKGCEDYEAYLQGIPELELI